MEYTDTSGTTDYHWRPPVQPDSGKLYTGQKAEPVSTFAGRKRGSEEMGAGRSD